MTSHEYPIAFNSLISLFALVFSGCVEADAPLPCDQAECGTAAGRADDDRAPRIQGFDEGLPIPMIGAGIEDHVLPGVTLEIHRGMPLFVKHEGLHRSLPLAGGLIGGAAAVGEVECWLEAFGPRAIPRGDYPARWFESSTLGFNPFHPDVGSVGSARIVFGIGAGNDPSLAALECVRNGGRKIPTFGEVARALADVRSGAYVILKDRFDRDLAPALALSRLPESWKESDGAEFFPAWQMHTREELDQDAEHYGGLVPAGECIWPKYASHHDGTVDVWFRGDDGLPRIEVREEATARCRTLLRSERPEGLLEP